MSDKKIYEYQSARQYILDSLAARKKVEPGFSIRSFARSMGLKSHTLLIMLLQGKRPLRVKHAEFLSKGLKLNSQERLYLQALIQFESANTEEERDLCKLWMADLNPGYADQRIREIEDMRIVSHWVHTAILAFADLESFSGTAEEVTERLGGKVSLHEVRAAIERLLLAGLLIREDSGKLRGTGEIITTKNDKLVPAGRTYQAQTCELAKTALETQPLLSREFFSFSIAIDRAQIPLAKELIRKFRAQFYQAMCNSSGNDVYQMNLHFFELTKPAEAEKAKVEEADWESADLEKTVANA